MAELPLLSVSEWTQHAMPPIDVLMVWHAYLLNPSWYAEDTSRRPELRGIRTLSGYLLQAIVSRGHEVAAFDSSHLSKIHVGDISQWVPNTTQQATWLEKTGTLFDPLDSAPQAIHHIIKECPKCFQPVAARKCTVWCE